ncbi:MAG: universal stress protein [Pseudomonadota bacterium]
MFKTPLLAVDLNDAKGMTRCAEAAANMARSEGVALHVLNVVPDSGMAIVGVMLEPDHFEKIHQSVKSELEKWAKASIASDIEVKLHIARGTIYDQIIKTANDIGSDAIFVGANRPELKDYLIGPNSARVARHAHQSVFVIR